MRQVLDSMSAVRDSVAAHQHSMDAILYSLAADLRSMNAAPTRWVLRRVRGVPCATRQAMFVA